MALNKAPQSMLDISAMQTVNVKDYGAIGNGVTNDYTAFAAALSAVNAAGGGAVIVPPGTYMLGQSLLLKGYENTNLVGSGIGATVLTKNGNFGPSIRFYVGQNNSISNLTLNCDGYSGRGIYIQDINSWVEYVEVLNCADRAIAINGGSASVYGLDSEGRATGEAGFTSVSFYPSRCKIINSKVYNSGRTGIGQSQVPYSEIASNYVELVYSEGIFSEKCDYSTITDNVFINVCRRGRNSVWPDKVNGGQIFADTGGGIGAIGVDGSSFVKIANNSIVGVELNEATLNNRNAAAIRLKSTSAACTGNVITGNTIENTKIGVWINDGEPNNSIDNIVSGNTFKTTGTAAGTGSAQYGDIWVGVNQNNNRIADNSKVNGTLSVTDFGSNNAISYEFEKPFVILALGQSNMTGNNQSYGGDFTIDPDVFMWDTDLASGTCVFGTKFQRAAFGTPPMNGISAGINEQILAYNVAKNVRQTINKKVYVVQVARGGHRIEAFLSDSVLSANSWSRSTNQDLSLLMYPGLGTALAAVPGSPTKFDAVILQQGEANNLDGADTYARKLVALIDELHTNTFIEKQQTVFVAGQLCFSNANVHFDRHTWAMKRAQYERPNFKIVFTKGVEVFAAGAVHFSGKGLNELGKRYASAMFAEDSYNEFKEGDIVYGPDTGFAAWTGSAGVVGKLLVDRAAFPLSTIENSLAYIKSITRTFALRERTSNVATITTAHAHTLKSGQTVNITCVADTSFSNSAAIVTVLTPTSFTYSNTGTNVVSTADTTGTVVFDVFGNGAYRGPQNSSIVAYTRKIIPLPISSPVKITYEICVDNSGGTLASGVVDHRALCYQYAKDYVPIGFASAYPTTSPLSASSGRVEVTRSFGRPGIKCDVTLNATAEYIALGFNTGVGVNDEPYYFNIISIIFEEHAEEIPDYLLLESINADASAGPTLDLFRNSASPAASDLMGRVLFRGEDSAGNSQNYAAIQSILGSPTSGSESSSLVFATTTGGALTDQARVSSDGNVEIFGGGKIGYATGSGGTVTQLTSKSTSVTINKSNGNIVTHNENLGNGSRVFFTVNNSKVEAGDVVIAHRSSGGTANSYDINVMQIAAGSFGIGIHNISGGALAEAFTINFAVIKAVTA